MRCCRSAGRSRTTRSPATRTSPRWPRWSTPRTPRRPASRSSARTAASSRCRLSPCGRRWATRKAPARVRTRRLAPSACSPMLLRPCSLAPRCPRWSPRWRRSSSTASWACRPRRRATPSTARWSPRRCVLPRAASSSWSRRLTPSWMSTSTLRTTRPSPRNTALGARRSRASSSGTSPSYPSGWMLRARAKGRWLATCLHKPWPVRSCACTATPGARLTRPSSMRSSTSATTTARVFRVRTSLARWVRTACPARA